MTSGHAFLEQNSEQEKPQESALVRQIFGDSEAKDNLVGLFDLLLKIDRRVNPQLYKLTDQNYD